MVFARSLTPVLIKRAQRYPVVITLTGTHKRGSLFENLVVMDFVKHALNQGLAPALRFYRDSAGLEVDLLVEYGVSSGQVGLVEIKAGRTCHADWLQPMERLAGILGPQAGRRMVVYGGAESYVREGVQVVGLGA
jgi:hypothetical protein